VALLDTGIDGMWIDIDEVGQVKIENSPARILSLEQKMLRVMKVSRALRTCWQPLGSRVQLLLLGEVF
jgi:hypothetical protein